MDDQATRSDAGLTLVVEDAERRAVDGGDKVGIGEHDVRTLATEFEMHLLEGVGGLPGHPLANVAAAGERDLCDTRVLDDALPRGGSITRDDVHDAGREADLVHKLSDAKGAHRSQLSGLHDHGIARSQCRAHLPAAEHHRKIPRDDLADDAKWLWCHVIEEACLNRNDGTLEFVGHSAEVPEGRRGARHIEIARVTNRMPGISSLEECKGLDIGLDGICKPQEQSSPIGRGHARPTGFRSRRCGNRTVDILRLRLCDPREQRSVMWIKHVNRCAVGRLDEFPPDEQLRLHSLFPRSVRDHQAVDPMAATRAITIGQVPRGIASSELDRIGGRLAARNEVGDIARVVLPN